MVLEHLGYRANVPGNASRFFTDPEVAGRQPDGRVEIAWDDEDPFLVNSAFDGNLISHDAYYCTSVVDMEQVVQIPTTRYFETRVLPRLQASARIVDIGCGQGEFVNYLVERNHVAAGFDPVLREESDILHARYWTPSERPADLYVLRCVLPHIPKPWAFLSQIAESSPNSLVLLEFQSTRWVFEHSLWYQFSHDHVNLFTLNDFASRYALVDSGSFSNGEWNWVLLDPTSTNSPIRPQSCPFADEVLSLNESRLRTLRRLKSLHRPVAIWGAAGKGTVLAHAATAATSNVSAIDADPRRWNLYLEGSAVRVLSPDEARDDLAAESLILVSNPSHYDDVYRWAKGRWEVALPSVLAQ